RRVLFLSVVPQPFGDAGDAHLVVLVVDVTELHARVGGDLLRLVVPSQVSHVDGEVLRTHRGDGADTRLVSVYSGQERELGHAHEVAGQRGHFGRIDRFRYRLVHGLNRLRTEGGGTLMLQSRTRAGHLLPHARTNHPFQDS